MLDTIAPPPIEQMPLIQYINEDDELLEQSPDADWYHILSDFYWPDYLDMGVAYYNALYQFNMLRKPNPCPIQTEDESKKQAAQRLLFDRPTVNKSIPVLFDQDSEPIELQTISRHSIMPGKTPDRLGGRKPKCFFALLKSFIGASLMGLSPEPQDVFFLLNSNLSFARVCGFIPKGNDEQYWYKYVPSLRKLEQFDQIMTDYGLWDEIKWNEIRENLHNGTINKENVLVGDTTHYQAFSGFETVKYTDDKGKEKTKSQSKPTKNCGCDDKENCPHSWEQTDDGAGTIVKNKKKMIWGHKASIIGFPSQEIALDAVAVADAATFDGETFHPHVSSLFENLPEIAPWIDTALYDSACDSDALKQKFADDFDIVLKSSMNPRRRKTVTENLPRGMSKLTPQGSLICNENIEMEYQGIRRNSDKYIYKSPVDDKNVSVCCTCKNKPLCCPNAQNGRIACISFNMLPHIDSNDPPMSKKFKSIMKKRPSVERMIKRLKCDLSDERLTKRGNASFQAYLDKTMIAYHILIRQ